MAILNSLNAHNFPIFHLILMILVSKFIVHRALSDQIYFLSLGLLSPFTIFLCRIMIFLSSVAATLVFFDHSGDKIHINISTSVGLNPRMSVRA